MRVFISADIEGTTLTCEWKEASKDDPEYAAACAQMTAEVRAACEAAVAAGADYILVNDAHGHGTNIDPAVLPECAEIIRGWSGNPLSMVDGVDQGFDAAMFIGYHSAAGRPGSPLCHTMSLRPAKVMLNGLVGSEFLLFSLACSMYGVPVVFLSGDKMLCEDSAGVHPLLKTAAVKEGYGRRIKSLHPNAACRKIRDIAEEALRQDLSAAKRELPKRFELEISYKEAVDAVKYSYYPGFKRIDDHTIRLESEDYMEILTAAEFVL